MSERPTAENDAGCVCPPDICLGTDSDSGTRVECAARLALDPELPCLRDVLRAELSEALAADLGDSPQRCGHSSDPMCCPYENFPTLAEFFDPDEDSSICGADEGFGICSRPAGHKDDGVHAVLVGGGSDPVSDPAVWFTFGSAIEKPGFQTARVFPPGSAAP